MTGPNDSPRASCTVMIDRLTGNGKSQKRFGRGYFHTTSLKRFMPEECGHRKKAFHFINKRNKANDGVILEFPQVTYHRQKK